MRERGRFYFLSFCCLVFSSPLDDLVGKRIWGRRRDDDDDDACVREKEGGRRAMTVKKKSEHHAPRRWTRRSDARRGGKNGGGNKGLRHVKYFYSSLVINFLRRSSFFRLLSLRSPFFFAPIFFPSFFSSSSCPSLRDSGVTNSAHFCRVFVRVYFRDGRKNVARIGRF